MTTATIYVPNSLRQIHVFDMSVEEWWRWQCETAGVTAVFVDVLPTERGTLRVDGRFLTLEAHDLAELDEVDGVLLHSQANPVVVIAGSTSKSALGETTKSVRKITSHHELVLVHDEATLAVAETLLLRRKVDGLIRRGVRVFDPARTWVAPTVTVAPGAQLWPDVTLIGRTQVEAGAVLQQGAHITNSIIGQAAVIKPYTVIEDSVVGMRARIGPFAHLRPGSEIGAGAHIGNFVETKAAQIGEGAKANHLTYLGDCEVGEGANIGAGTITCNYDGARKHRTVIGPGAFVGTHTSLVAPVVVGAGALVAAGSVITAEVPAGALAVARADQKTVPDKGRYLLERNIAAKLAALHPAVGAASTEDGDDACSVELPAFLDDALIEPLPASFVDAVDDWLDEEQSCERTLIPEDPTAWESIKLRPDEDLE